MRLLSIIILSFFFIQEPIDTKLELENFVFSKEELPDGCKLKLVANNSRLPCKATANPFISSDRGFLDCFTKRLIQDSTLVQQVKRGLFSVYEGQSEIGIFGLETDSKKTTTLILDNIMANSPNDGSMEFIQSGKILIWLWRDREETNSFHELKKLINARIK
ncbi:hypothetical protein [Dokdonia sp.]|uniref:hypothetical protein n=1 Tax=Dokdonia sp. TaxID=2024995 RepID=UPI00326759F5